MGRFRSNLPQLGNRFFLTDGGIETFLIFHRGAELPYGAAYVLLAEHGGTGQIQRYFDDYLKIASDLGTGFILESATWRANPDWARKIGTSSADLEALNRKGIDMLVSIRDQCASNVTPIVISGCIGPRADAYRPSHIMTAREAEEYHATQIAAFSSTDADMVSGLTLTNVPEAIGITRAARAAELPVAISFTLEVDGRLPTGPTLEEAIGRVDDATDGGPAYFMVNCAHPTHIEPALRSDGAWTARIRGLRANASSRSHAELDESQELDEGNPRQLGVEYRAMLSRLPHVNILGGCCGTDYRHIREVAEACIRG